MSFNGFQPFEAFDPEGDSSLHSTPARPQCCCGNTSCAFLRHNLREIEALQDTVRDAGRLGSALLVRHEALIADTEKERGRMGAEIEKLGVEKLELERTNAAVIQENRSLLDQLEKLNTAVLDSETHIENLTSTLRSTQEELTKLNLLSSRTERLERELEEYEREQAALQESLASKTEDEKAVTLRWRESERKLALLEGQLEQIEHEAKEEKERHVEIVGRMERRLAVAKELDTAAGRLKGAAAAKTTGREQTGTNVVSHFVKDILQDNANLQVGIVELRGMLTNSNEEVERLREQLSQFTTLEDVEEASPPGERKTSLGQELSRANPQELHVHHHYHAPPTPVDGLRAQTQTLRRPKKKRHSLTAGHFTPPSGTRTPRSSMSGIGPSTPLSAATILSQTAVSIPSRPAPGHRWSMQSNLTMSSIPSTPMSYAPSIFDRTYSEMDMDSSRPTTPDSEDPGSPMFTAVQAKRASGSSSRNFTAPPLSNFNLNELAPLDTPVEMPDDETDINGPVEGEESTREETLYDAGANHAQKTTATFMDDTSLPVQQRDLFTRPLRRANSHESLLSISGMDIHTLQNRPSQLLTASANVNRTMSSQPVVSATVAHAARPALTQRNSDRSRDLLSGMAADQRAPAGNASSAAKATLGRRVGGWVWGRWGATPQASTATTKVDASVQLTRVGDR
ncbi:hypothetical protein H2203_002288 [Taxawa tesnikishii (nom. ined.)]|nr:hypothetical protein H2203_002288 [Dothideales sp. JES 119]